MDKGFLWVTFIWLILMLARNIYKGKKEKEKMIISKEKMQKYFNGRCKW